VNCSIRINRDATSARSTFSSPAVECRDEFRVPHPPRERRIDLTVHAVKVGGREKSASSSDSEADQAQYYVRPTSQFSHSRRNY